MNRIFIEPAIIQRALLNNNAQMAPEPRIYRKQRSCRNRIAQYQTTVREKTSRLKVHFERNDYNNIVLL